MSIVKERIALRRGRREGEKTPHRIRLDAMASGDFLIVEVDVNKKSGLVYYYLFSPEQLSGRRAVTFRKSGDEIYWLSGLKPKPCLRNRRKHCSNSQAPQRKMSESLRLRSTGKPNGMCWYSGPTTRWLPCTVRWEMWRR